MQSSSCWAWSQLFVIVLCISIVFYNVIFIIFAQHIFDADNINFSLIASAELCSVDIIGFIIGIQNSVHDWTLSWATICVIVNQLQEQQLVFLIKNQTKPEEDVKRNYDGER